MSWGGGQSTSSAEAKAAGNMTTNACMCTLFHFRRLWSLSVRSYLYMVFLCDDMVFLHVYLF
jgi:hypothetical protein